MYVNKIPVTSYHILFFALTISVILFNLSMKKYKLHIFSYLKGYILLMFSFMVLYVPKLLDSSYDPSLRDFIIIYSGLQYILIILVIMVIFKYKDLTHTLIKINLYIMPLMGVISIFQILNMFGVPQILLSLYSKLNSSSRMDYLYWNPRSTATFNLEPNTLGLYMAFSLLMFHVFYENLKMHKVLKTILYLFGLIGLVLSGSFTAILIYIFSTFLFLIAYNKIGLKLITLTVVFILSLSTIFYDQIEPSIKRQKLSADNIIPSSLKHRFNDRWVKVYNDFESHFLIGIGPSAIQLDYSTDNEYLDKFLRYGIIGGSVFLLYIFFLIYYPYHKRKGVRDPFTKKLFLFSSLLAICFAMASLTGTAFKAKRVSELFWIFYSLPFIKLYLNKSNEQKQLQE
ncbi:MAG: hypothetical protein ACI93N_001038 [Flavobacteriaceae bacterium]|jgi:hypothetical protein